MTQQLIGGKFSATYPDVISGALKPAVGYKLHTYVSGTTTNLATWSDSGLTAPNTNPVTLDARGEASVFLGSGTYTMVLKSASGSTIWTRDGIVSSDASSDVLRADLLASSGAARVGLISPAGGAVARTVSGKLSDFVSVKDFGALGNGINNDAPAINLALAYGGAIYFPDGVYLCYSQLNVNVSGVSLFGSRGAILDMNSTGTIGTSCLRVFNSNFSIDGLTLRSPAVRGQLIYIQPVSAEIENIRISGTKFEGGFYAVRADGSSTYLIRDFNVIGCDSTAPVGVNCGHFFGDYCDGLTYANNVVVGGLNSSAYGVADSTNITITGNRETDVSDSVNDVEAFIQIEDCPNANATISGNVGEHDIWVASGTHVTITGNRCRELRVSIGNAGAGDVERVIFDGNIAGRFRADVFAVTPPLVDYSAIVSNNIFDPAAHTKNGAPLSHAFYIVGGDRCKSIALLHNTVVSSGSVSCVQMSRTGANFTLRSEGNNFGSQAHGISGNGGYMLENNCINSIFKGSASAYGDVVAGLSGTYTPTALSAWTKLPFTSVTVNLNSEFATGTFTPIYTGLYEFSGVITVDPDATGDQFGFRLNRTTSGSVDEIARLAFIRSANANSTAVVLRTMKVMLYTGNTYDIEYFITGATSTILSGLPLTALAIKRLA